MIRKQVVYRRKLKGFLLLCFFSLLIFAGVFSVCMGIWFYLQTQTHLITPLPKAVLQQQTADTISQIENLCIENHLTCTDIHMNSDGSVTVTLDTSEQVIFSLQKDLRIQIASLQLTIAHLTIDGKRFRQLDFRYDKPVISF